MFWSGWVVLLILAGVVLLVGFHQRSRIPAVPSFEVRAGAFDAVAAAKLGPQPVDGEVRLGNGDYWHVEMPTIGSLPANQSPVDADRSVQRDDTRRRDLADAALIASPGVAVAGVAVADVVREKMLLDDSMLNALTQLSGQQVDGLADFLNLQSVRDYQLESIKLRGTIGEQQSATSFEQAGHEVTWPAGGPTEFGPSNNPGWDFQIDGQEVNIKVTQDAADAASAHFAKYPDIPMVVNADASNIPADAIYFDPEIGLDPASIVGENVTIVNESLTLSGIESLQGGVADVDGTTDFDAAGDAIPVLSFVVAAVHSGVREGRLARDGKTSAERALKNVGIDTASKGGGAAAGAWAGGKSGAAIDAMAGGTLLGIPTLIGAAAGAMGGGYFGGRASAHARLKPLRSAQTKLLSQLEAFDGDAEQARHEAEQSVQTAVGSHRVRLEEAAAAAREAYVQLVEGLRSELSDATSLTVDEANELMLGRRDEVRDVVDRYEGDLRESGWIKRLLATNRVQKAQEASNRWDQAAEKAVAGMASDGVGPLFDVLMALPGGRGDAEAFLDRLAATRGSVQARAVAANEHMVRVVAHERARTVKDLEKAREAAGSRARSSVSASARNVERARDSVWKELDAAGARPEGA